MTRWKRFLAAVRLPALSAIRLPAAAAPIVFVRLDRIAPEKIDAILRDTAKETPLFRAVLQILEDTRDEAIESEAADAWNPTAMAMHSGGAKYLRAVRDELIRGQARRGKGMGMGKTPNAQRPTPNAQ